MSGMVSTCERSLSLVVTSNKLKMLTSLAGRGQDAVSLVDTQRHRQTERT